MFDISKLEIADTADYHVTNAAGVPQYADEDDLIPVTITVLSPGSKKAVKAKHELDKARQSRVFMEMNGRKNKRTEEADIQERAEFLAVVAGKLNNFEYPGGAVALYSNSKLGHITDGVEQFYLNRGNFSADLSTSSSNTSAMQPG